METIAFDGRVGDIDGGLATDGLDADLAGVDYGVGDIGGRFAAGVNGGASRNANGGVIDVDGGASGIDGIADFVIAASADGQVAIGLDAREPLLLALMTNVPPSK